MAGNIFDAVGTFLDLPEWGISESLNNGRPTANTGRKDYTNGSAYGVGTTQSQSNYLQALARKNVGNMANWGTGVGKQAYADAPSGPYAGGSGGSGGGSGGGAARASAADLALYDDQMRSLQSLLGRTNTGLSQALTRNNDEYNRNVGAAEADKAKQLANYEDKRVETNKGKLDSFGQINRNANNGFRSLAQIIGRAAGTGSSAFSELLPDVVGKDTAGKRQDVVETYGRNLQGIDKAQNQYLLDFQGVLEDLQRQRNANEENVRGGIESQRQNINSQLASIAAAKAQAAGGGAAAARAAAAPYQSAIENSRNAVEGFFNQFRAAYTPRQAVAAAPELSAYNVDRSTLNAQNQGQGDAGGGYAEMLRRRLQENTPLL